MSRATASQLRLVRDAVGRMNVDAAERDPVMGLLAELIAVETLDLPRASATEELAYQQAFEAMALDERQSTPRAATADTLDLEALAAYLNEAVAGEGAIHVRAANTVSRGMSKKTVLISLEGARTLPAELALRVDRTANNYLGTTVVDEWGPLRRLWDHGARIPQPFALEAGGGVIGDPFIVFARASGAPVGSIYVPPGRNTALLADTAGCMARVHTVPVDDWPRAGQPVGDAFFDAQFAEYLADWQALGERNAIMEACFDWIDRHRQQAYGPPAFTHDDFNYNNMLVEGDRVSAVLDWEFAHVGTPAADVAYIWYAAENMGSFADFLRAYVDAGGWQPPQAQLDFYLLWGQLRLGVMGHKAVRNLEEGHFDDVRYALSRWHRRQALFRLSDLLDRLGN
ncbi:phosphotransferase [Sandaracinobacter sp. RS1-74]|uniref:phosphotransferase n=1 Tax=Sandaracinobacteroides sayramensis TaxID=2913411 RepID=UPI001EDA6811|nr:phosphotransferase [Sandaracinobacteroides sayramensis]MCG2840952.1 phosphotransferase [Sandaracinobacteroides sayramensis]